MAQWEEGQVLLGQLSPPDSPVLFEAPLLPSTSPPHGVVTDHLVLPLLPRDPSGEGTGLTTSLSPGTGTLPGSVGAHQTSADCAAWVRSPGGLACTILPEQKLFYPAPPVPLDVPFLNLVILQDHPDSHFPISILGADISQQQQTTSFAASEPHP